MQADHAQLYISPFKSSMHRPSVGNALQVKMMNGNSKTANKPATLSKKSQGVLEGALPALELTSNYKLHHK